MLLYAVIVYPVSFFLSHVQYVQEGHIWGSQTSKEMEKMGLSPKKKQQNKSYWTSFNPLPFILGCWPRKVRPVWVFPCFCPDVRLKISQTKLKIQGEAQNVTRKSYRKRCQKLTHFSGNVRHIRLKWKDLMLHHYELEHTHELDVKDPLAPVKSDVGHFKDSACHSACGRVWFRLILFQTNSP